jgi:hypothetical protein
MVCNHHLAETLSLNLENLENKPYHYSRNHSIHRFPRTLRSQLYQSLPMWMSPSSVSFQLNAKETTSFIDLKAI